MVVWPDGRFGSSAGRLMKPTQSPHPEPHWMRDLGPRWVRRVGWRWVRRLGPRWVRHVGRRWVRRPGSVLEAVLRNRTGSYV